MVLKFKNFALVALFFLASIFTANASVQKLKPMALNRNRTTASHLSDGSSCSSSYDCGDTSYCYDGLFSDTCTQCFNSNYPCNSYNSLDGVCCISSSSPSPSSSSPSPSSPSPSSSPSDFSWANLLLTAFFPGYYVSLNNGCSWTIADASKSLYYGNCGNSVFLQNNDAAWCTVTGTPLVWGGDFSQSLCLANSSVDCCEIAPGPTAGISIALILFVFGIIACICRCCRCFCFKSKAAEPQIIVVQAPAATTTPK